MAIVYNIDKSWPILLISESNDCPIRYRKWNPPTEGWFCKVTKKHCTLDKCPMKTKGLSNQAYSAPSEII